MRPLSVQRVRRCGQGTSGRHAARGALLVVGLAVALAGCAGTSAPDTGREGRPPEDGTPPPGQFSADRAFGHLRSLVALGPRPAGSDAAAQTRDYVRRHLEALGLTVEEQEATYEDTDGTILPLANLEAVVPGEGGRGRFVVATPLDTARAETFALVGANEGASGVALLLEVARVLVEEPLPYDVTLLFLDGERIEAGRYLGSELALQTLAEPPRLMLWIDQVADADLVIHRDLWSHRVLRESFFRAAERLGLGAAFPRTGAFDQIPGGHRVWFQHGWRRVVALADIRYGSDEPPGALWRTAEDDLAHVSAGSLGIAGRVVVAGLRDVAAHLARVDAHIVRPPAPAPKSASVSEEVPAGTEAVVEPPVPDPATPAPEASAPNPSVPKTTAPRPPVPNPPEMDVDGE